ncbi:VirB4 family type IV secretion/conjugal transfer ATPase [Fundidesulfovibrio putealis]|uniref:VirB4 family type IV secretion/conjugal transfer ATPase n=1 Tax=Fundidesulfovibrio putealis TaxID=270496 RepID=UPI0004257A83|nr:conjugal transfer protein TrbE [Fundidesulfovibrio putealis]KAF0234914.1 MAG: type IV secretion system protein [Desulfovibrionaceae bacterium]
MLDLRQFRSRNRGLGTVLPYAALVEPGIVMCKDGTFLAGFEISGHDTASSTPDELAGVSAQFNNATRVLGTNWLLNVDAVRAKYRAYSSPEKSFFPDPITQMIDDERRSYFGGDVYRTRTCVTLAFRPDLGVQKVAAAARVGGATSSALERSLAVFKHTLLEFEDAMSAVLASMRRLEDYPIEEEDGEVWYSELLSHLQLCVSGVDQPVRIPRCPMYLDALLGSEDLVGGFAPRLGEKRLAVVAIDGLPQESWPSMLASIDGLPLQYRFSTRFICLDQYDAQKEINTYRKAWKQGVVGFFDKLFNHANPRLNRDAQLMEADAEEALTEVQGGYVGAGYVTSNVVLMHEDETELRDWARELRRTFITMGFGCRIESINAMEAWFGSHPGNWFANVRRPMVNTMNLADLLPLSSVWTGEEFCPCPFYPAESPPLMVCTTDGATPVWINLHVGDVGHTLIYGPPGSGKSTLLALIAAQFRRYERAQIFAFDKGMSLYPLCTATGGTHHELGKDKGLAFAPLQHIDDHADRVWAEGWIADLLVLQEVKVTPAIRNAIHAAMELLAGNPRNMRSLSDFVNQVQDDTVKEGLRYYTRYGTMGHLLDAESDTLDISSFLTFDVEELMGMGDKTLIPVLLYLFRRIERALTGQPTVILLDEAWIMLGHPVFLAKIREWLKVMRKANCAVVLATQNISDAAESGIMNVLADSCHTKVFLANVSAREINQRPYYEAVGLNDRQIDIISTARPKRDYYWVTPEGRRLVQLGLQKKALAFVGVSDKESIARIKVLQETHKESWPQEWLKERAA